MTTVRSRSGRWNWRKKSSSSAVNARYACQAASPPERLAELLVGDSGRVGRRLQQRRKITSTSSMASVCSRVISGGLPPERSSRSTANRPLTRLAAPMVSDSSQAAGGVGEVVHGAVVRCQWGFRRETKRPGAAVASVPVTS